MGRLLSSAIALPSPTVEPPPTATAQSAPRERRTRARPRHFDRHVHRRPVVDADGTRAQPLGDRFGHGALLRRAQHQRTLRAQRLHFVFQMAQAAAPKITRAGRA